MSDTTDATRIRVLSGRERVLVDPHQAEVRTTANGTTVVTTADGTEHHGLYGPADTPAALLRILIALLFLTGAILLGLAPFVGLAAVGVALLLREVVRRRILASQFASHERRRVLDAFGVQDADDPVPAMPLYNTVEVALGVLAVIVGMLGMLATALG